MLNPEIQRAVRRGRRRHVLRRQALQPDQGPAFLRPQGADRVRQGRRAARDPLRQAKPHIGTFRLVTMVESMRAKIEALGGEIPLRDHASSDIELERARRRPAAASRGVALARRRARSPPTTSCSPSATARATPSQMLHDARRRHGSQAVLDRLSHRASAVADRPRPLRADAPATRCSAPPTTSWCTTRERPLRSTASACAPAARWWRRPPSPAASSPTA